MTFNKLYGLVLSKLTNTEVNKLILSTTDAKTEWGNYYFSSHDSKYMR